MKKRHQQKLILLSLMLVFVWNIPMIMLYNHDGIIMGFPMFFFVIFSIWTLVVILSFYIIKRYDR